jgi:DNA invertase Pin-like site-specific DNA recombinase
MRYAIPYTRFSTGTQAEGDTTVRQTRRFQAFCLKHHLTPWEGRAVSDAGVSGFLGHNRKHGKLADLLTEAEAGLIPAGTVVVVEAQDRLGRDQVRAMQRLIDKLVDCGLALGDCVRDRIIDEEALNDPIVILDIVLTAARAVEESKRKGDLVHEAFERKREAARNGGPKFTKKCPFWLDPVLVPVHTKRGQDKFICTGFKLNKHATTVRRIFELSAGGMAMDKITGLLNKESVPSPIGTGWLTTRVRKILTDRRTIGEYQPRVNQQGSKAVRFKSGDVILGYFPAVIEETLLDRVQLGLTARFKGGRCSTLGFNVFRGLLRDARTGGTFQLYAHTRGDKSRTYKLVPIAHKLYGKGRAGGILYQKFLDAFLRNVKEIDPADFAPDATGNAAHSLTAKLTRLNAKLKVLKDSLTADTTEEGDVSAILDAIREVGRKRDEVKAELDRVHMQYRSPAAEAIIEIQNIADINPGLLRNRVRSLVSEIWILVNHDKEKNVRSATVQVHYHTGQARMFWVLYSCSRHRLPDEYEALGSVQMNAMNPSVDMRLWRSRSRRTGR